ncbi:cullin-like protein, putative [Plasmodium gallinaceum]|uniref:Cullin-like protein, putative n=1 Tax=Plasmodium gallinaceum TaxID=5849 RepID=A0A1J1H2F4_PLAGA|nr:cullin-like protein, putative [Plasmodium gallinaceum]CRG97675.1 cullin-like protein, putative [Plasmodium gallinaceum]
MDIANINFENGWKIIKEEAIEKIEKYLENDNIEKNKNLFSATEYTRLYTVVYNMCAKKNPFCYSKEVYRKYGESLSLYAVNKIKPLLKNENNLIKTKILINAWIKYSFYTNWMNKFLRYLDRYYVEYNSSLCLSAYTKNIFKITLFNDLRDGIKDIVYEIYDNLRMDEKKDEKKLFCDLVHLYKELDKESNEKMYEHDIEKKVMENVDNYYKKEGDSWVNTLSFDDYIISIENSVEKEYDKNKSLNLNEETCEKITNIIVKLLIFDKLDILLKSKQNIYDLLKNNNLRCLRRTYLLFSYFPQAIEGLKKIIGEYVKAEGNNLKEKYIKISKNFSYQKNNENEGNFLYESNTNSNITEQKDENVLCEYIDELIKLHNHYDNVFKLSFFNISNNTIDQNFKECLKDYFESFVEYEDENFSTVKLLVLYSDNVLKKDVNLKDNDNFKIDSNDENKENKIRNEIIIENHCSDKDNKEENTILMKKMSDIVEIFNYTSNKETFFEYYRVYLANRLINNIYISLDIEKKFIENLYYLCGSQYTSKLGGMIQDMINNRNMNKKFYDYVDKKYSMNLNELNTNDLQDFFSVKILNKGYWPTLEKTSIKLNNDFNKYIELFEEYYKSDHKNRKLEWIYDLSEVILEYFFNNTMYYLYCNVVNAQILLLFNKYTFINFNIVKRELNLDLKSFTNNMYSCFYNFKIISTNDNVVNWSSSDFYINKDFSYHHKKVFIKKTTTLLSKEHEKTKEDRTMAIEAAIVRVMKVHKKLFYDQIFDYVKRSLSSFSPTNQIIEKKIDLLVEREYIQKEENSQVYLYIP